MLAVAKITSILMGNDVEFVKNPLKFSSHVIHFSDLIAPELKPENLAAGYITIAFLNLVKPGNQQCTLIDKRP